MTDRPKQKPASGKSRNDSRSSGKAAKKGVRRGARKTRLSELDKALMGGGAMKRVLRPAKASEARSSTSAAV